MQSLIFIPVNFYLFSVIAYVLLIMLFLLLISIVCSSIYKRKMDGNKNVWQQLVAGVINQAVLFDDDEEEEKRADITEKIKTLLQNRGFRD